MNFFFDFGMVLVCGISMNIAGPRIFCFRFCIALPLVNFHPLLLGCGINTS